MQGVGRESGGSHEATASSSSSSRHGGTATAARIGRRNCYRSGFYRSAKNVKREAAKPTAERESAAFQIKFPTCAISGLPYLVSRLQNMRSHESLDVATMSEGASLDKLKPNATQ